MRYRLPALCLTLLTSVPVHAENRLTLGGDYWNFNISGTVRYQSSDPADDVDVVRDLGYRDGSLGSYYLELQHDIPLLPNARLGRTSVDQSASGYLTHDISYGGSSFTVGEDVSSTTAIEQTDVILYYGLLDSVASLDVGVDARHLDTRVTLDGAVSGAETASASGWVPMLYARAGVDLPLTGVSIAASGSFAGYQGDRLYELDLRASYTSRHHLGAEVGYRRIQLQLKDFDSTWADLDFDGPYAGILASF
jgi:outer membrane protein